MRGVNYQADPGLCIMTTFYGAMDEIDDGLPQLDHKLTVEQAADINLDITSMLYLGYDNNGFASLKQRLFEIFNEKSRFEK